MTRLSEAVLNNTRGVVLTLNDAAVVSLLRPYVDFFIVDCASRLLSVADVEKLLAAAGETPLLVRAENSKNSTLQKYLNLGVDGLILPDIHFATEAEKAIAGCLYPPEGIRPYRASAATKFGLANDVSLTVLNDQITFVIEIAHPQTVAQLEELAEVTGVDGFLINPERLSVAMEKGFDVSNAEVTQALQRVQSVASAFDMPFGWEGDMDDGQVANFHVVTSDVRLLAAGARAYFPVEDTAEAREEVSDLLRAMR